MARIKKTSSVIAVAEQQLMGLKNIDVTIDFGGGLTYNSMAAIIDEGKEKLNDYNNILSLCDEKQNQFLEIEKKIKEYRSRIMAGIIAKFGKDSTEYELVGGTRTSERKKKGSTKTNNELQQ